MLLRRSLTERQILLATAAAVAGLLAVAVPTCLVTLPFVTPPTRVYIAVLSVLVVVMAGVLAIGMAREAFRLYRHATLQFRKLERRRAARQAAALPARALPA